MYVLAVTAGIVMGIGLSLWQVLQLRGFLKEFGTHKGHCATKIKCAAPCTCGLYYAIRIAFGHREWKT